MKKEHKILLGIGIASAIAGYFWGGQTNLPDGATQAYNLGFNYGFNQSISLS